MAIVKCPECGHEVSDTATKCPSCGKVLRKPKRSIIGKIFLWIFYLFNAIMLIWLVTGLGSVSEIETTNQYEEAGAAIGTGIGVMFLLTIWVIGDIITGLLAFFTRPKL